MATTTVTASQYRAASERARTLRSTIASYERPMDERLVALVLEREGQAALERLQAESVTYLAACREELAPLAALIDAWQAQACPRCTGMGIYSGPTSHRNRHGQAVCFQCKGSGRR